MLVSGLGPHVVGQRVVVRRVLPGETGPSGGPAMSDVLGVCEEFTTGPDGRVVVRREDGERVAFPTRDVVSGKPVPPRPDVRMRVSSRDAEEHGLALWPGVELHRRGDWVLRTEPEPDGRRRKRANSCLAMGEPDVPLAQTVGLVSGFYAARGRPALVQVEQDSTADALFADAGWEVVAGGEAAFLLAPVARTLRGTSLVGHDIAVEQEGPWLRATTPGASAAAGLHESWVGLHSLVVEPALRRRGVATALVAALLERAAEQGAGTAWLHVETRNEAAIGLYDSLGFAEHHLNRYRREPA